jgi:sec-independent protein translocase protein TatA
MLATWMPNGPTLIVLCILGVILFGRRLPEIGRSLGKGLKEFQNGMSGMEDQLTETLSPTEAARPQLPPPPRVSSAVPRFEDNHATEPPTAPAV